MKYFYPKGLSLAMVLLIGAMTGCKLDKTKETSQKPSSANTQKDLKNVVFILVDDLGWKDLGCYGSSFFETPNIDKLAQSGVLFTSAYSANPVCSPTRAALMTGRHPSRIGITDWIPGHDPQDRPLLGPQDLNELPLQEVTMAEVMKEKGYTTFYAGKWHLGDVGHFPEDQGFDINKGGHHMGHPPGGYYAPYNNPKLPDGPTGEYLTDRLTDESIAFLEDHGDDPFLLYLAYYTVHTPIEASKRHLAKFEEKRKKLAENFPVKIQEGLGQTVTNQSDAAYASMVYALDENVGRLLDKLEALGIMDDTVVIFTSDNGGLTTTEKDYDPPTSVRPLRAGKGWAYEGGIRIPLIIKGTEKSDYRSLETAVTSMDMFPTVLDLAGLEQRPELHLDGKSLKPVMKGNPEELHEAVFWDYPHYHTSGWTPGQALRKGDWKLVRLYENDTYELYNLKEDMAEKNDLAIQMPEKLNEMKAALQQLNKTYATQEPRMNQ